VLARRSLDHKPLSIGFAEEFNINIMCRRGSKFEARWLLDEESNEVIKKAWQDPDCGGMHMQRIQQKLAICKSKLGRWSWQKYGSIEKAIKKKTKRLEVMQQQGLRVIGGNPSIARGD
jgi:hypothetical protein